MPTQGAMRAASKIQDYYDSANRIEQEYFAQIIDEETGLTELIKGAKQHIADIERCTEVYWVDEDLLLGINKAEGVSKQ